jgi:hypothetical protein
MDKARQIIYSVMMGFVLKYFMEHTYSILHAIQEMSRVESIFYSLLLTYFFLNCFRYLFGIFSLSKMTDNDYEPKSEDWIYKKYWFNLKRQFVIHAGIIEVTIFGIMCLVIFPDSKEYFTWNKSLLNSDKECQIMISKLQSIDWKGIVTTFFICNTALVIIDLLCVYTFRKTVEETKSKFNDGEKLRCSVWLRAGLFELGAFSLGIIILTTQSETNFVINFLVLGVLFVLQFLEIFGIYNYEVLKMKKKKDSETTTPNEETK